MTPTPVTIPSLGRPELCARTVRNLVTGGIPFDAVTVFLSDPTERPEYEAQYEISATPNIVDGVMGITAQRNLQTRYYENGAQLVCIDDDVTEILELVGNKLRPVTDIGTLFTQCFNAAQVRLWGSNPTGNPFYMKNKSTLGWKFAVGCLHGYVVDHALPDLTETVKEDYERSALYFEADGAVARFDWLTTNNRYGRTPGGCGTGTSRDETNRVAAANLIRRWPYLFAYKRGSDTEIRCTLT